MKTKLYNYVSYIYCLYMMVNLISGTMYEQGHESGKYFSVNVPLREGIDDRNYQQVFKPVIEVII